FTGGNEGRRRDGGRDADQGNVAETTDERKILLVAGYAFALAFAGMSAGHVVAPKPGRFRPGHGDIGVMVAGNDGDMAAAAELLQEIARLHELVAERDVHQIAGDRDMVRPLCLKIIRERLQHLAAVDGGTLKFPREEARDALAHEGAQPG